MKKKQFMSKLAALTMAAAMGVTALPATVMAAGVKDVTATEDTAANAAATGLVQTTLPTSLTDEATLEAFQKAYIAYDDAVEDKVKALDKNAVASDVNTAIEVSSPTTVSGTSGATQVQYKVEKSDNFSITPATGNTAATAGSATIPVTFTVTIGDPASKTIEQHLNLSVKWGTDVQDVLAEAVKLTKEDVEKDTGTNSSAYKRATVVNATTKNFDKNLVKNVVLTAPTLVANVDKDYNVTVAYVDAGNYVAPTSTAAGGYDVTLKVTVTGKNSGTPAVPVAVTASQNVTCHVTLAKLSNVRVTTVAVDATKNTADSVWKTQSGGTVATNYVVAEAGKEYPIDVKVDYDKAEGGTVSASNSKADVEAAGVTVSLKDNSVAHLVDSTKANTGKAIVFDKVGSVEIDYTTPYYKDVNNTDPKAVTSKTDKLGTAELKDETAAFESVYTDMDKTVSSSEVSKADDVVAAVKAKVQAAYDTYYGKATKLDITVKDVRNFKAATAGTAQDPDGTNGSFYVKVSVQNDKDTSLKTGEKEDLWTITADKYTKKFTDVSDTSFCAKAVAWGVDKDIVAGTTDTTFSPKADVTRAQFVTFLYRQAGSPDVEINKTFTDISGLSTEFQKAVSWAAAKEITNGVTATTFAPNATVTREQAVTFLFRYANGKATTKAASFKDVDATEYYADAVNWGAENGVVEGYSADTFGVGRNTNRGEAITFIYRALAD